MWGPIRSTKERLVPTSRLCEALSPHMHRGLMQCCRGSSRTCCRCTLRRSVQRANITAIPPQHTSLYAIELGQQSMFPTPSFVQYDPGWTQVSGRAVRHVERAVSTICSTVVGSDIHGRTHKPAPRHIRMCRSPGSHAEPGRRTRETGAAAAPRWAPARGPISAVVANRPRPWVSGLRRVSRHLVERCDALQMRGR